MNDRRLWWPRGKGLGGSSAINGMVYIRGHARDYDQWRQMGLTGWCTSSGHLRHSGRLFSGERASPEVDI